MNGLIKIKDLEARLLNCKPNNKGKIVDYIPSISGQIISVFPPKTGTGKYGAWQLQNIVIKDETGQVSVSLGNLEVVSELSKGKSIYFESVGGRFGLTGVTGEWNEYTDKSGVPQKKIVVNISKTAIIKLEGAEFVQSHPIETIEATMLKDAIKAKQATLSHPISQSVPQTSTAPNLVDQLRRYEVLYQRCLDSACNIKNNGQVSKIELSSDNVKDIATTFFIQSVKDGLLSQVLIGDFKNPELESETIPF